MQCKNIPEQPILDYLASLNGRWATWCPGWDNSVMQVMPPGTPPKLARAKMNQLIKRGLVDGCTCGCRGDYELK